MGTFRLHWDASVGLSPTGQIVIRDSEESHEIRRGDLLYIVTEAEEPRLLARVAVNRCTRHPSRRALVLDIDDPKTAFFFRKHNDAIGVSFLAKGKPCWHREATQLTEDIALKLADLCGTHDFSSTALPPIWPGTVRSVERVVTRAVRDEDTRPSIEVAVAYLRRRNVTSELPGPSPVYVNAARYALAPIVILRERQVLTRRAKGIRTRRRGPLTDEAIQASINDDSAITVASSLDTRRHQLILWRLRDKLQELGFTPLYDGFVDCIVEAENLALYFEVKSATHESLHQQVRLGVGQLLYYIWQDSRESQKPIRGHLVVEDASERPAEIRDFVESLSLGFTWSSKIDGLMSQHVLRV